MADIFSEFGSVEKILIFENENCLEKLIAYIQMSHSSEAKIAQSALNNMYMNDGCCFMKVNFSKMDNLPISYCPSENNNDDDETSNSDGDAPALKIPPALEKVIFNSGEAVPLDRGTVVTVSNLNEEVTTLDHLFNLFSSYGNVMHARAQTDDQGHALVEFQHPTMALAAVKYLDQVCLFGQKITVAASKHRTLFTAGPSKMDDYAMARDNTKSALHRFPRCMEDKRWGRVVPPSSVLHVTNIDPKFTLDALRAEFATCGTVKAA